MSPVQRPSTEPEQLEMLRLAEAMSGVGHWRLDLASQKVTWSEEVYRIYGVDPATYDPNYGEAVSFYRPQDQERVRAYIEQTVATGEGFEFRGGLIRADGQERRVVSRAAAERDATGAVTAVFGVFQDVTEQEQAHERLVASEARYRLLAGNATDVIAQIGLDGRNTFVSEASMSVLGRAPETLLGRSTLEIVHPDDAPELKQAFKTLFRDRRTRLDAPVRYRAQTAAGEWLWMEAHPTLVFDDAGEPLHFVDVVRDISRRRATEAALEAAVAEANAAAAAKTEFLANVSHELRTPLTSIMGFVGLLQQFGSLTDQDRRFVNRIGAGGEALLAMIGDVLDYSKLEAGRVELHAEPLEVNAFLLDTISLVGPAASEKWLTLKVEAAEAPAALTVDRTRLRQVLLNLLNNAVKFTGEGGVMVRTEAVAGDRIRFSVADTGIGIPAESRDRLFKRFSQVDGSTVRDYGGTGLGLAICKSLVEVMGGEIGCDSAPGQGSTFWFTLPVDGASAAAVTALAA